MSGPSKIPAIRNAVSALHGCADDGADTRGHADALQAFGDAVAELIAADSEYDRARAAWLEDHSNHGEFLATRAAWDRRAAALDRVKGGAA